MLAYPYLLALYRAVLQHSAAIKGRVFMAPFFASELNTENLNQILADSLSGQLKKQYPLSLILPPISDMETGTVGGWSTYQINQLFLKQEARTSDGQVQDINVFTNNSQHTITQDWHDMRRCAEGFLYTLKDVARSNADIRSSFRVAERGVWRIVPVTRLGNDRTNGVLASYTVSIFEACVIEDYPEGVADLITVPIGDQHPEHIM